MERVQKIIANYGYCSRRKAEELIRQGKVKINGVIVKELGYKANHDDKIEVEDCLIEPESKVYYLLNKPRGVITSTNDDKNRKTVIDLINSNKRIYPVGRLDYDTTGILLLTNDGELANLITHPKNKVKKVYIVKIKGIFKIEDLKKLEKGVYIDNFKTSSARVKIKQLDKKKETTIVELTIHEGRNHQVKKMFNVLGYDVLKLKREKISFLDLTGLNSGEYRKLSNREVKELYSAVNNKR